MANYINQGAIISSDQRYRYMLWREWRGTHDPVNWEWFAADNVNNDPEHGEPKAVVFIMLNPSTADGSEDDPTIRRCVGYARRWRYEKLLVVNLFAHRATSPKELLALNHGDDPVGWENQHYVKQALEDDPLVICAWGDHGSHLCQNQTMRGWLVGQKTYTLGLTKGGHPKHPLYLPSDAKIVPYDG